VADSRSLVGGVEEGDLEVDGPFEESGDAALAVGA